MKKSHAHSYSVLTCLLTKVFVSPLLWMGWAAFGLMAPLLASDLVDETEKILRASPSKKQTSSNASIEKVLALHSRTDLVEQSFLDRVSTRLTLGTTQIRGPFRLEKDNDYFISQTPSNFLWGGAFGMHSHLWVANLFKLQWDLQMGIFSGSMAIRRSGIENYEDRLDYTILPVQGGLGWAYNIKQSGMNWDLRILAGLESTYVSQIGKGKYDTLTSFYTNDFVSLALQGKSQRGTWDPYVSLSYSGGLIESETASLRILMGAALHFS